MKTELPDLPTTEEATEIVENLGFDTGDTPRWRWKYRKLRGRVSQTGQLLLLSFRQYMRLAKRAGLTNPDEIGCTRGTYQLGRKGDSGHYEWGNCRFITIEQNIAERKKNGGAASQGAKLRGRTAKTHDGVARTKAATSKRFRVKSPTGRVYTASSLREFCQKHNLARQYVRAVFNGKRHEYKGWTGSFIE